MKRFLPTNYKKKLPSSRIMSKAPISLPCKVEATLQTHCDARLHFFCRTLNVLGSLNLTEPCTCSLTVINEFNASRTVHSMRRRLLSSYVDIWYVSIIPSAPRHTVQVYYRRFGELGGAGTTTAIRNLKICEPDIWVPFFAECLREPGN
jgi:hypothetical protein